MTTIINQLDLHTRLFNNILFEISNEQSEQRMSDNSNHLKWLAGHLLSIRYSLCQMARIDVTDPFIDFFSNGKSLDESIEYPTLDAIKDKWNEISQDLSDGLATLPEKVLTKGAKFQLPTKDQSVFGMLGFMMHHEGYHLGQMSMLRRNVGKGKMSYR